MADSGPDAILFEATMPTKQRLAVKLFRIIEGEAEGTLAIWVFLVVALAAIGVTAWSVRS